ncbi:MAG: ATP-binding protein [Bryobacterales bacterium]|nr:ATP-binding protein [Bryobacterales bacterium]
MTLAIRQILDNALKYSNTDSPVSCLTEIDHGGLTVRVADRGPGIQERDRERVFEKFHRLACTRAHVPGTGLGLHIAREIARMHGGELWVEPNSPAGAVFCLRIPLRSGASE